MSDVVKIKFDAGTLVVTESAPLIPYEVQRLLTWDPRTKEHRCEAHYYRQIITALHHKKIPFLDEAKKYSTHDFLTKAPIYPRSHQQAALTALKKNHGSGVVSLPTGAGKTILAILQILTLKRSTFIVVPTIDLMQQWENEVKRFIDTPVGLIGGGEFSISPVTICTYDSAVIHAERLGHQFGFIIFDECHHLPATQYQTIAKFFIAPFRLGLSATIERTDGREELLWGLVGELVYEGKIHDLQQNVLAPYDIISIEAPLTEEELDRYRAKRKIYTDFIRKQQIDMSSSDGWMKFLWQSTRSKEGKEAHNAYREQKRIAFGSNAKMAEVWKILKSHSQEKILIFTDDNQMAYDIGKKFLVPVLTHHTKLKERKKILECFRSGEISVISTSKVLNEGVDVPDASVGIVVSGSGTVREHVQRLGRILRHKEGKRARLYEIVSKGTSEYYVNLRRKQHYAYQRTSELSHP